MKERVPSTGIFVTEFVAAWTHLHLTGLVGPWWSDEYKRVRDAWIDAGRPAQIGAFILAHTHPPEKDTHAK